jgi:hypothetical protein
MQAIIKSPVKNTLELPKELRDKVFGRIRLWIDVIPPTATDIWIIIGEFVLTENSQLKIVKSADQQGIDAEIQKIFAAAKVSLTDYGTTKNRSFHLDIKVTQQVIDGYAG